MSIIVTGSLAYDRIMDFPGHFHEHILPEKIHMLNVSFTVNGLVEKFGGTAGNIAYGLALLGEQPVIVSAIGRDYHRYFDWLSQNRLGLEGIRVIEEELTACAYITTDRADNQITGFNPGAMKHASVFDFSGLEKGSLAAISAGNLDDMTECARAFREAGNRYIFDPGQSLPSWEAGPLAECIRGSGILISNDYELELICHKTGLDRGRLLEMTEIIITTLGELGSQVQGRDYSINIPAVAPKETVDPTGAGDAYRAGLIKGLVQGLDIEKCAMMGSTCASFAVEHYGTQEHSFSMEEFEERFSTAFPD